MLIDDSTHEAVICAAVGVKVVLLDHPWNRNCPPSPNIVRVFSYDQVYKEIERVYSNCQN